MNLDVVIAIINRALVAAGLPARLFGLTMTSTVQATWVPSFIGPATGPQQAQALTIVTTTAIDAAAQARELELQGQEQVDAMPIATKALLLTMLDQVNTIRNLLPLPLGAITPAQALAAWRAKAGTL